MPYNIGIDIGEHTTRLAIRGRGVVFRQSSSIAMRQGEAKPLALGNDALKYAGRLEPRIEVAAPLRGGMIADEARLTRWLYELFLTATASGLVHRPRALILADAQVPPFMARQLAAIALDQGAVACAVLRSDLMAALGAGRNIQKPEASLIADIGAGKTTISLFSLGRVVASETLSFGMRHIDESIVRALRTKHGLIISARAAEDIKLSLASAVQGTGDLAIPTTGMKPLTGFPATVSVTAAEIHELASPIIQSICDATAAVIERAPVELAADLNDSGLSLVGGGAQLPGLDRCIAEATGLACHVAEDPAGCAIRGVSRVLENPEAYETLLKTHRLQLEKKFTTPLRS